MSLGGWRKLDYLEKTHEVMGENMQVNHSVYVKLKLHCRSQISEELWNEQ